jgi:hypothetical protein
MYQKPEKDPVELLQKLKVTLGNGLGTPNREITQEDFVRAIALPSFHLETTYYDQIFLEPYGRIEGRWDAMYYIFPNKAYAAVSKYTTRKLFDGRGIFIPPDSKDPVSDWQWGYQTLFFRVGCEHKNIVRENLPLMMKRITCKDCGYVEEFSTDD